MKNKIALLFLFAALAACKHTPTLTSETLCDANRKPSQAASCRALVVNSASERTVLDSYIKKAAVPESGLTETTFTTTTGEVLRKGPDTPKLNKHQIVSFFSPEFADGTLNRGGTMVQGTPTEIIFDAKKHPAYIIFAGQTVRILEHTAYMGSNSTQVIKGQSYKQHAQGFSSPVGLLKGWKHGLSEIPIYKLKAAFAEHTDAAGVTTLQFESGVVVKGVIERYTEDNSAKNTATVISFKKGTCKVTLGERVLFDPAWGVYDMVLATTIVSTHEDARTPANAPRN